MAYTIRCQSFVSRQSYSYLSDLIADVLTYVRRSPGNILEVYYNGHSFGFIVVDSKLNLWWFNERAMLPIAQSN